MSPTMMNYRALAPNATGTLVRRIQIEANERLDRRGEHSYKCKVDGKNGPATARAVHRALYCLGVSGATLANAKKGYYSVGAQRKIDLSQKRSPQELDNATKRMAKIRKRRDEVQEAADKHRGGPANLTPSQREEGRKLAVKFAKLGLNHAAAIHYTMGSQRWQGIADTRYAGRGQYPTQADCSSYTTWVLWNVLHIHFGVKADVVNGASWLAGFTGTQLSHGLLVDSGPTLDLDRLLPGDLIIYGSGYPGKHVAMYIGGGMVISHGSEGGPYLLRYNYRSDIMCARRYI